MTTTILCADDFGLTDGVSTAIAELADVGRISATSCLVTTDAWQGNARLTAALRGSVAVGLHVNLTLGQPLTTTPSLVRGSGFPSLRQITMAGLTTNLDQHELEAEITAQIKRFEDDTGTQPDFIDGHQHVHALPQIRRALIAAVGHHVWQSTPLIRTPSDTTANILARGVAVAKSMVLAALATGFRSLVRRSGLVTNDTFAGVSSFSRSLPYGEELAAGLSRPGPVHLVMCHPGFADDALRRLDPVVERRVDEYGALMADATIGEMICHPAAPARNWHDRLDGQHVTVAFAWGRTTAIAVAT